MKARIKGDNIKLVMCALGEIQWYITKLQDTRPVLLGANVTVITRALAYVVGGRGTARWSGREGQRRACVSASVQAPITEHGGPGLTDARRLFSQPGGWTSELKVPCTFQGDGAMSGGDPTGPAWLVQGCGQCRWAFWAMMLLSTRASFPGALL